MSLDDGYDYESDYEYERAGVFSEQKFLSTCGLVVRRSQRSARGQGEGAPWFGGFRLLQLMRTR